MKAGTARNFILAAAGLFAAVTMAGAQGFGGEQGRRPGAAVNRPPMERAFGSVVLNRDWWNNPRIVERLKLTDDQRKAMDQILLDHREKLIDLRADLQKAELAMEPLMNADTPNDSAILAQTDKIVQARGELEKANARFLLAIRDKLTAEQWKQIQDFRRSGELQQWRREEQHPGGPGEQFRHQGPSQQAPVPPSSNPGSGTGTDQ